MISSVKTALITGLFSLLFVSVVAAQNRTDLPHTDRVVLDQFIGMTVLFRNESDKIPQVEYLADGGMAYVWSAALENRVVPAQWRILKAESGRFGLCIFYKAADIGTPNDLRLCDVFANLAPHIKDAETGDIFDLQNRRKMAISLPFNVSELSELDTERAQ
jgi:hypothetical protein